MSRTYSRMTELGASAPDFELPVANPESLPDHPRLLALGDLGSADVLVVVFTCNHCPYAVHVEDTLIKLASEFASSGVQFVAISSNDPRSYPEDSFEAMAERAREKKYPFPYLFDETQDIARAYGAVCTPDPFVFDRSRRLAYRGRVDATRPGMGTSTGDEMARALRHLIRDEPLTDEQFPSMGCNIKWKPGNQPHIAAGTVPSEAE